MFHGTQRSFAAKLQQRMLQRVPPHLVFPRCEGPLQLIRARHEIINQVAALSAVADRESVANITGASPVQKVETALIGVNPPRSAKIIEIPQHLRPRPY